MVDNERRKDDRRIETLEAELKDVGTHMSDTDRRVRALETAIGRLAGGADIVHEAQPSVAAAVGDGAQLNDDEWCTKIADLTRELEGARRVAENQRRIANERAGERDEAVRGADRLKLELEEAREKAEKWQAIGLAYRSGLSEIVKEAAGSDPVTIAANALTEDTGADHGNRDGKTAA